MRVYLTLLFMIFLLGIAFIFGSQNSQLITLNYLIAQTQISAAMAVSLFTTLGFLLGLLFVLLWKLIRALQPKNIKG